VDDFRGSSDPVADRRDRRHDFQRLDPCPARRGGCRAAVQPSRRPSHGPLVPTRATRPRASAMSVAVPLTATVPSFRPTSVMENLHAR
jgi:hypothetical protein